MFGGIDKLVGDFFDYVDEIKQPKTCIYVGLTDKFFTYGKEYPILKEGEIHVRTEDNMGKYTWELKQWFNIAERKTDNGQGYTALKRPYSHC